MDRGIPGSGGHLAPVFAPVTAEAEPNFPGAVTTTIAIYAALVSTVALALGLITEWRSWGTRVGGKVQTGMAIVRPHLPDEPAVVFRLINHGTVRHRAPPAARAVMRCKGLAQVERPPWWHVPKR